MKRWSNNKYHYKIVSEEGEVIAFFHGYLEDAEKFVDASHMTIKELSKKGSTFEIKVTKDKAWKI